MFPRADLKNHLHRPYPRLTKLLLILGANHPEPARVSEIERMALDAGFREIRDWNISNVLRSSKGRAVLIGSRWELTEDGRTHVIDTLCLPSAPPVATMALDLRDEMDKLTDPITKKFVEEAVICYEAGALRSAVVMSWQAAIDHIYNRVLTTRLAEFNTLATNLDKKWDAATDRDGLATMKEFTFLERACTVKVIDKNVKHTLEECLKRRNAAGHPNSFTIGPRQVAAHIETLIQNVFQKFAAPTP
jgi:hypothetical protein